MSTDEKASPVQGVVSTYFSVRRFTRTFCIACGSDVTDTPRLHGFCSCPKCDAWTMNVDVKDRPLFDLSAC